MESLNQIYKKHVKPEVREFIEELEGDEPVVSSTKSLERSLRNIHKSMYRGVFLAVNFDRVRFL